MKTNIANVIQHADKKVHKHFSKAKADKVVALSTGLKWVPIATVFALDALNNKGEDKIADHAIEAAAASLLLNAAVLPLKYIFRRERPNGDIKSFPSKHTATSFLGAALLHKYYKDKQEGLVFAGYAVGVSVALMRLYYNKHWLSDVLASAAIGIASVKLSPVLIDKLITKINVQPAVY